MTFGRYRSTRISRLVLRPCMRACASVAAAAGKPALALLLVAGAFLPAAQPGAQDLDRIVAIINDDVIMRSELAAKIQSVSAQMQEQNIPLPPQSILERQVLDRLIITKLQIQMAQNTGIRSMTKP